MRRFIFLSDVHLRADRPERDQRLAALVRGLTPQTDHLVIAGDLLDYWMITRQYRRGDPLGPGMQALADFHRAGGELTLLAGNHDAWFASELRSMLGVGFSPEPWTATVHGLRIHLEHGHLTGARPWWKGLLESRLLYECFRILPAFSARWLEFMLDQTNDLAHKRSDQQHTMVYRTQAAKLSGEADVVVFGHLHGALDDRESTPRLVVLGGWQKGSSYLVVDEQGARFHQESKIALDEVE